MNMPTFEGGFAALIAKYGLGTLLAAVGGAMVMAMFRPPKTRKEMFQYAIAALGTSYLFGGMAFAFIHQFIPAATEVAVHGLLGAVSWGLWAGLATYRDKLAKDPVATIKEIKDAV